MTNGGMVVSSLIDAQGCVVGYVDRFGRERDLAGNLLPGGYRPAPGAFLTNQRLWQSGAPVSVTGTTSETVLATIPIPAGAMGPNGALRITAYWSYPNNANTKNLKVTLGGVSVVSVGRTTFASDYWLLSLINRGLQNSQVRPVSPFPYGSGANGMSPMAVDTSVAQNLIFSAQPANAADTITLEAYTVELLNP
ncbi:hypothetical protein ACKI2N_012360 [Cupriavidus sp. 30B13]|uniref:hypothetical protein n=1 Tax=Cupriavidus sp. 30B13 TaxID=3384241 RepID=UPI003B91E571